jgi:hypothetical protein
MKLKVVILAILTSLSASAQVSRLNDWCNYAGGILNDARINGREAQGMNGDSVEALTLFKAGLDEALLSATPIQTQGQTFTLRYVQRGLALSQILGVDALIEGASQDISHARELVAFFDWYLGFSVDVGQRLDRSLYVPYLRSRITSIELENRAIELTGSLLKELDRKFIRTLPDGTNMYSTIGVPSFLRALAYLLPEVANDLRDSLFAESRVCQARRLDQLATQINRYLDTRNGNSFDAIRLNRFTLNLRNIATALETPNCF